MIDVPQLRLHVVRPSLQHLELWSEAAENLVLGTALVESGGEHLVQLGKGPALGLWQCEPATHDDVWKNYLASRPALAAKVHQLETIAGITAGALELIGNLYYGAAICRLVYRRSPRRLPDAYDARGMAEMWKTAYNTPAGAGTVEKAEPHFAKVCAS